MAVTALDIITGLNSIEPLKAMGMIQNSFMFKVSIGYIPFLGPGIDITYLASATSIPEIKTGSTLIKNQMGQDYMVPGRKEYPHDWSLTLYMLELDTIFRRMYQWYNLIDTVDLSLLKTTVNLQLISLNKKIITKLVILLGCYPSNYPGIAGLQYNNGTGVITGNFTFNFDEIVIE
jgi:hypothetical protein